MTIPWIIITILVLLVVFLIGFLAYGRKNKQPTDYYNLFIMGLIWAAVGIPLKIFALSVMGVIFMIVGLVHRDKWKKNRQTWNKLSKKEQKWKLIIIIGLGILVLIGLIFFLLVERGII